MRTPTAKGEAFSKASRGMHDQTLRAHRLLSLGRGHLRQLGCQLGVLQRSAGALSDEWVQGLLDVAAGGPVRIDVAGGDVDERLQPLHTCREGGNLPCRLHAVQTFSSPCRSVVSPLKRCHILCGMVCVSHLLTKVFRPNTVLHSLAVQVLVLPCMTTDLLGAGSKKSAFKTALAELEPLSAISQEFTLKNKCKM